MKKHTIRLALVALLGISGTTAALAQYAGPGSTTVTTASQSIAEILRKGQDDARVELDGYLIKKVGKKKYIFSDGKEQIRVEIDAITFPKVRIDEKTKVRIQGEVEKDFLSSPEIDVDRLTVLF